MEISNHKYKTETEKKPRVANNNNLYFFTDLIC